MGERQDQNAAYLAERDVPCPKCGYNLRGIRGARCPECAHPIELDQLRAVCRPRRLLLPITATVLTAGSMPLPWIALKWMTPAWTKTDGQYGAFAMAGNLMLALITIVFGGVSLAMLWSRPGSIRPAVVRQFLLALAVLACVAVIMLNGFAALSYALER